jgi:peptide deformylase
MVHCPNPAGSVHAKSLPLRDQFIMSIQKIYKYPEPVLRQKTEKITAFDDNLAGLVSDMAETMYDAPGIGLAAPQIGRSVKLIIVDTSGDKDGERCYLPLVNPEIVVHEGSQIDEEGCLSVLDLTASVKRFKKVTVSYQDLQGQPQELSAEDRFAVVLQHEIDHLNGILFLDHLSPLKRALYKKKVKKWLTEGEDPE